MLESYLGFLLVRLDRSRFTYVPLALIRMQRRFPFLSLLLQRSCWSPASRGVTIAVYAA